MIPRFQSQEAWPFSQTLHNRNGLGTFRILDTPRPLLLGRYYSGVVPANRRTGICCTSCTAVKPVYGRRSCAKSVENSRHHSDTQSTKANSSGGLQGDYNNAGPFAVCRKVHRANVHLGSITTAISRALLWWPVRFPADRFNNCRGHSSASHFTHDVVYRPVRPRLLVWHRQAWDFDEQDSAAEYPRQHLQLDKGVLWAAISLHEICRGMLDGCSSESQCYSRLWTGPSIVHRHHNRPAPNYARELHF